MPRKDHSLKEGLTDVHPTHVTGIKSRRPIRVSRRISQWLHCTSIASLCQPLCCTWIWKKIPLYLSHNPRCWLCLSQCST